MENTAIKKFISAGRSFTTGQATAAGISRQTLCDCCASGRLIRLERGIYLPVNGDMPEAPEIAILQRKCRDFVLCLFSALKFYNIGTQNTPEVWISIKNPIRPPVVGFPLKYIQLGEKYYDSFVEDHTLNGMPLKVYSPARTIADCFRFRNKVGLDVALEAMRDAWQKKLFTVDELYHAAEVCRITKIITPYMEMLVG